MSKINIRGFIAGPEYDGEWAQRFIERGLWTPSSKVRRDLEAANPNEPLTMSISSPGGSVFDGYEMANAIRDWSRETGQPVTAEVGALAASMGSYLGFFVADSVAIHRNTKAMFHGATTITWAGKEGHEDAAELLGQINEQIRQDLLSKGVLAEKADEWLAEGRMGWLDADALMQYGMAETVLDADAPPEEKPDAASMEQAAQLAAAANKPAIAAALTEYANTEAEENETETSEAADPDAEEAKADADADSGDGRDEPGDSDGEPAEDADDAPKQADSDGDPVEPEPEPADALEAVLARLEAAEGATSELEAALESSRAGYRKVQGENDRLRRKNASLTENLTKTENDFATLRQKWDRLVGTARAASASNGNNNGANGAKMPKHFGIWKNPNAK